MTDKKGKDDDLVSAIRKHGLKEPTLPSELPDEPEKPKKSLSGKKSVIMDTLGGKPDLTGILAEHGIAIRYNVRRKLAEATIDGGEWAAITDRIESRIRSMIDAVDMNLSFWRNLLENTLYLHEVDPFVDYLEALPAWDGTERIDTWCATAFQIGQYRFREMDRDSYLPRNRETRIVSGIRA